ncbi:zymogen granule membrane protein 16-like [Tachyglossus aculeatus]|uniref:zymogen granule membrane protein 16-like n=1 Tax=Tachyglossus aculeatus TaxID=9261 RepID=UPI0018F5BADC|nr:zymogen granule membrane protein 16-like [Tachyglossus aculeatus]
MIPSLIIFVLALLGSTASLLLGGEPTTSSSGEFGAGVGTSFSFATYRQRGKITGFRIREQPGGIITGIQFQFEHSWTSYYGYEGDVIHEVLLDPEEVITQVSGKHHCFIYQVIFGTNLGRQFYIGQSLGTSFNAHPLSTEGHLLYVSGHHNSMGLTGLCFHWEEPRKV